MKFFRALGIFLGYCLITGCPKNCIDATYSFNTMVSFTPKTEKIKVGDTLYLQSTISKMLQNSDGRMINYDNASLIGTNLGIMKLIKDSTYGQGAVYTFKYFNVKGKIYNSTAIPSPERFQQIEWVDMGSTYEINVGLIANERGLFILYIGDALGKKRKSGNQCEKANFYIQFSNQNQHLEHYKNWNSSATLDGLNASKMYCFEVE